MVENAYPATTTTQEMVVVAENHPTLDPTTNKEEPILETVKPNSSSIKRIMFPLTILVFLLSFPVLFCVVWLLYVKEGICEHLLSLPKLQIGLVVGLILLFVVSNAVVFFRSRFLMTGLILVMIPLIVILTIGLTLLGAYTLDCKLMPGSPAWLDMMVNDDHNWNAIESCIYNTRTCQDLVVQSSLIGSYDFSKRKVSPIVLGCCTPPSVCDMEYVNVTYWEKKIEAFSGMDGPSDIDCDLWQNDITRLCYDCYACRKGFVAILRQKWYKLGVFLVVVTILLIGSHLLLFVARMWEHYALS